MTMSAADKSNFAAADYYPPRARWHGRLWKPWRALRRELNLDGIRVPAGVPVGKVVGALIVPGYAFSAGGRRLTGRLLTAAWALGLLVILIALGRPAANFATAAVISLHVSSLLYLLGPATNQSRLPGRILIGLALVFMVTELMYLPLQHLLERWALPVEKAGRVIVINTAARPEQRGDWVAYRTTASGTGFEPRVVVLAGLNLDPVLAFAGDRIVFTDDHFEVNGMAQPRRRGMPGNGEWRVPADHLFVWPTLAISNTRLLTDELMTVAMVPRGEVAGVPYRRWFWWRQEPE
jgi:hypothetical protein